MFFLIIYYQLLVIHGIYLPMLFRFSLLALEQSYDFASPRCGILKILGEADDSFPLQKTVKHGPYPYVLYLHIDAGHFSGKQYQKGGEGGGYTLLEVNTSLPNQIFCVVVHIEDTFVIWNISNISENCIPRTRHTLT